MNPESVRSHHKCSIMRSTDELHTFSKSSVSGLGQSAVSIAFNAKFQMYVHNPPPPPFLAYHCLPYMPDFYEKGHYRAIFQRKSTKRLHNCPWSSVGSKSTSV